MSLGRPLLNATRGAEFPETVNSVYRLPHALAAAILASHTSGRCVVRAFTPIIIVFHHFLLRTKYLRGAS